VRVIVRGVLRPFGVRIEAGANMLSVQEEIMGALSIGHSEGVVEKEHRDRLLGALDLHERTVEEIMLHRSGIEMIDADLPAGRDPEPGAAIATHAPAALQGRPGKHRGRVHAKDLLRAIDRLDDGTMRTRARRLSTSPTWR
jgi:Mg2+/Co2+ transporter CorB